MRAKLFILPIAVASLSLALDGCTNARRFLPGGVVKVKDLAKDRPVSSVVAAEIETAEQAARAASFPVLSELPDRPAETKSLDAVRAETAALIATKAALEGALAADRAAAIAERESERR